MKLWVFWSILAAVTFYTGVKMAELMPGREWLGLASAFAFILFIVGWQFAYRAGIPSDDSPAFKVLAWTATIGMGVWSIFVFFSLSFDIGERFLSLFLGHGAPMRAATGALMAASLVVGALGVRDAIAGPLIKEVAVPVPGLSPGLDGLRIAQISDLHIGPTLRRSYVERVVDAVVSLKPDLIAVTGDLADGRVRTLEPQVGPLSRLKAPMGVFYVTGNHEYYWGAQAWLDKTRELGFVPLVNEHRIAERDGARLLIGGVPDSAAGHFIPAHEPDAERAAAKGERRDFSLLLSHRPDRYADAEQAGFDLQLSGHTHGGQFFPWSLLIPFFHRYYKGLNRHGRLWVYVSSGTGYWGPPLRFAVPSEITLLRLVRQAAPA